MYTIKFEYPGHPKKYAAEGKLLALTDTLEDARRWNKFEDAEQALAEFGVFAEKGTIISAPYFITNA